MPKTKPQDSTTAAKQVSSRWLLLLLFAACSFGVTYGLVIWSRKGKELVQLALGRVELPSEAPPGMVWIPGGKFTMGTDDKIGWQDEKPAHRVRVDGFWM